MTVPQEGNEEGGENGGEGGGEGPAAAPQPLEAAASSYADWPVHSRYVFPRNQVYK